MTASFGRSERLALALRELYRSYGYRQYKVGKFEEYDLYAQHRSFLTGEHILTFSDLNGRLMALKPDVTLSIIKNTRGDDRIRKLWYTENVYRVPRNAYGFQEILQTGLECIGAVDLYAMAEVVMLAARSLETVSERYVLSLSHLGILTGALETVPAPLAAKIIEAVGQKNLHALRTLCLDNGVSLETTELLSALCLLSGPAADALPRLMALSLPERSRAAALELESICGLLGIFGDFRVNLDLSVTNDTDYYNGLVFRGFVDGAAAPVLSGGQYDNLLSRMGRTGGALGFAVYLSELERLLNETGGADFDVLLMYDDDADPAAVARRVKELVAEGQTVRVQPKGEPAVTCRRLETLGKEGSP